MQNAVGHMLENTLPNLFFIVCTIWHQWWKLSVQSRARFSLVCRTSLWKRRVLKSCLCSFGTHILPFSAFSNGREGLLCFLSLSAQVASISARSFAVSPALETHKCYMTVFATICWFCADAWLFGCLCMFVDVELCSFKIVSDCILPTCRQHDQALRGFLWGHYSLESCPRDVGQVVWRTK